MARAWISGQPFNVILRTVQERGARLIWGETLREFTIEQVVAMCENGLAFDAFLLVGALIDLVGHISRTRLMS